jgi:hypothetical protein
MGLSPSQHLPYNQNPVAFKFRQEDLRLALTIDCRNNRTFMKIVDKICKKKNPAPVKTQIVLLFPKLHVNMLSRFPLFLETSYSVSTQE